MAEYKIIIAGFGGQGIVLAGSLLANAALLNNKHVAGMVSYGAEVRGGTASSFVIFSDDEISSPLIETADIVIALNQPSFEKYKGKIKKGGYIVLNSTLVTDLKIKDVNVISVPATETATKMGNIRMANIIAIGALLKNIEVVPIEKTLAAMEEAFTSKKDLIEINKKALLKGVELG